MAVHSTGSGQQCAVHGSQHTVDVEDVQLRHAAVPAYVQTADGDVTEANFGNDDETREMLEDMGVPGSELVEADMSRMNSGSAQRRRQATRLGAADILEDEDDVFGSKAIEATSPDTDGDSDFDDGEPPIVGESHVCRLCWIKPNTTIFPSKFVVLHILVRLYRCHSLHGIEISIWSAA